MQRQLILLGSSYRCGSTLVQRILNSIPGVFVAGEDNITLKTFGNMLRHSLQHQERSEKQIANWLAGNDDFQANMGIETGLILNSAKSYYHYWFNTIKEKYNLSNINVIGFKSLFPNEDSINTIFNVFPNPYVILLTRNIKDSYSSYKKCVWGNQGYDFNNFLNMWIPSQRMLNDEKLNQHINLSIKYEDITKLSWLNKVKEDLELDIDYDKVKLILDKKIKNDESQNEECEISEYDKLILNSL